MFIRPKIGSFTCMSAKCKWACLLGSILTIPLIDGLHIIDLNSLHLNLSSVFVELGIVILWLVFVVCVRRYKPKRHNPKTDSSSQVFQAGNGHTLREHFAQTDQGNMGVSVASYDLVMQECNKLNKLNCASEWLSDMHRSGAHANTSIYNNYIDLCMKAADVEEGNACLVQMFTQASSPNNQSAVRRATHVCAKNCHPANMKRMLQTMHLANTPPDAALYMSLISACAHHGRILQADMWFAEMTDAGHSPRISVCSDMVRACARVSSAEKAGVWFERLLECDKEAATIAASMNESRVHKELLQKKQCYSIVISMFAKVGNFTEADRCLRQMQVDGCAPDIFDWNNVLSACCKVGNIAAGKHCIERMIEAGLTPDSYSYNNVLNACAQLKDMEALGEWVRYMAELEVTADVVMCNTVLNACVKAEHPVLAMTLFQKMREPDANPKANEISYAIVARLHAGKGEWHIVEKLLDEMVADNYVMNGHHYRALFLAYGTARPRQSQRAEERLLLAKADGVEVNRPVQLALASAVGWPRCNQLLGRRVR